MRQYVMTLLLLCAALAGRAQQNDGYQPLVEEGKWWTVQEYRRAGDGTWTADEKYGYYLSGDTLIDGKTWKKLYTNRLRNPSGETIKDHVTSKKAGQTYYCLGAMMEEDKKVYAVYNYVTWGVPRQVYDFNLEVGDTVWCSYDNYKLISFRFAGIDESYIDGNIYTYYRNFLVLNHIDTVRVDGRDHRRLVFSVCHRYNYKRDDCVVWVEGVGSNYGPCQAFEVVPNNGWFELSCNLKGQRLFSNADFYSGDGGAYHGNGKPVGLTNITWKLAGFGTVGEEEIRPTEPYVPNNSHDNTICFLDDGSYYGYSVINEFCGIYSVYGDQLVSTDFLSTRDFSEDTSFLEIMSNDVRSYELRDGQLRLYYNDGQDFLLLVNQAEAAGIDSPTEALAHDGPLFDLQGRRLAAKPQKGVYIQGGRKYVVR